MSRPALALLLALVPVAAFADPLVVRGDRLYVAASIEGHPVEALLDSAAELSFADRARVAEWKLGAADAVTARGSGGEQDAGLIRNVTVSAFGVTLSGTTIGVTDLSEVGARLLGRRLDAIIGHDVFGEARLAIDIEGGTITRQSRSEPVAGAELPVSSHDGIDSIPVQIAGRTVQADFDLGNGSGPLISKALVASLGLHPVGVEPGGGIGGAIAAEVYFLPELEIAGVRFPRLRARLDPHDNAGPLNIGVGVLRRFVIVTDLGERKVWLAPRPRS
ncbi:retropepsin-like aspartic protease [Novosphingobium sp.]|uniref:retropepsin-like aspartic protease n=1 Tax=Novosphingobium sp. TaxID=1874826 RepID=UPI00260F158A|nr:retropepsin-like aspartic protease [Novosphingobium sp.]